ncbi:hypothetical protein BUALT_Bualt03G0223900 [Buddleja alternifolia]|uniref:Uncharacterized protein n=1 Tax=Buddleja alternifolia TaxID=168488 RepID=A0AAV6XVV5_9LAMI|nr:hypothetical protein BUALT_Bualt03G0223900 [Buddleja alternifolia]
MFDSCPQQVSPNQFSAIQGQEMAEESKTKNENYEKPKIIVPNIYIDEMKTPTRSSSSIPSSPVGNKLRKSASIRQNCLCSPTQHAGSFRCRYHRSTSMPRSSMSVGSKLSELTGKSPEMCDNLLMAGHNQGT